MHEADPISKVVGRVAPRAPRLHAKAARRGLTRPALLAAVFTLLNASTSFSAEATNSPALPLTLPQLPDAGPSVLRVMGALALVLGLFLGGVWVYRNWQRLTIQRGRAPKLNVIETRPLGGKHALYVIGYEQERFLLASSPAGVNLLSHLPGAEEKDDPNEAKTTAPAPSFAQALTQVLKGK
jgi:flagellar biogenesis protein FliO